MIPVINSRTDQLSPPPAASRGSAEIHPVQLEQLPEVEEMIAALAKEEIDTPLKVFYEHHRNDLSDRRIPPADRLQRITNEMKELWEKTTEKRLNLPDRITLDYLQCLQRDILDSNLFEIGKLWDNGFNCFGCFITLNKVKSWIARDPEKLQDRLVSAEFCKQVALRCTFLPPEIVRIIPDVHWQTIGQRALFPNVGQSQWDPNLGIFLQIVVGKKEKIPSATMQKWLDEAAASYRQWTSEVDLPKYEKWIRPLVDWARDTVGVFFDRAFITFIQGRPFSRSHFMSLGNKVSDQALKQAIDSAKGFSVPLALLRHAALRPGRLEFDPKCMDKLFKEAVRNRTSTDVVLLLEGGWQITQPCFDQVILDVAQKKPEYRVLFLPHLRKCSNETLGKLLEIAVYLQCDEWAEHILKFHIDRVSDRSLRNAFLKIKCKPLLLEQCLIHVERLGPQVLGEALYNNSTDREGEAAVTRLLTYIEIIPLEACFKALFFSIAIRRHHISKIIIDKMSQSQAMKEKITPAVVSPYLHSCSLGSSIAILSYLKTNVSVEFSELLRGAEKRLEAEENRKKEEERKEREEREERERNTYISNDSSSSSNDAACCGGGH